MKRLITGLLMFLTAGICSAQITASLTTYERTPKEFQARYLSGNPVTTPYVAGDPDTFQVVTVIGSAIDSVGLQSQPATVFLFDVSQPGTNRRYTYYDTLRNSVQHILPAATSNDTVSIRDSVFYVVVSTGITDGESFELRIMPVNGVRIFGDTLTVMPTFSVTADSLNTF